MADLSEATLQEANLVGGDFTEASLKYADLSRADLSGATLEGADLRGANFTGTNLNAASIYRTLPEEPDLTGALSIPSSEPPKMIALASGGGGGGPAYCDPPDDESKAVRVTVYFVTDRNPETQPARRRFYGIEDRDRLSYGTCEVSIPRDKPVGEIPRPSLWKLEFRENLQKHVVLLSATAMNRDDFHASLSSGATSALLFVHGYKVSFEDAARRTAQLTYDLAFDGVPIFYSWASRASLKDYPADLASNERTWHRLGGCLSDISGLGRFQTIHIISHSMGCRAICHSALEMLVRRQSETPLFKNVVFAAPDVEIPVFRDTLTRIGGLADRFTLYFSPHDIALQLSQRFHRSPRAGEVGVFAQGLDTIDASATIGDILGHSQLGERTVVNDIFDLFKAGLPPAERFGLIRMHHPDGEYFEMRP